MTTPETAKLPKRSKPSAARAAGRTTGRSRRSGAKAEADIGQPGTKLDRLISLLSRPEGATLVELSQATGWLPHSVRGAMAGALKKKGLTINSEKTDGVRSYRIGASA